MVGQPGRGRKTPPTPSPTQVWSAFLSLPKRLWPALPGTFRAHRSGLWELWVAEEPGTISPQSSGGHIPRASRTLFSLL